MAVSYGILSSRVIKTTYCFSTCACWQSKLYREMHDRRYIERVIRSCAALLLYRFNAPVSKNARDTPVLICKNQSTLLNWKTVIISMPMVMRLPDLRHPMLELHGRSRGSTIGDGGDTAISFPGMSPKLPLPGIRLHNPLHGRQACPEFIAFDQGDGQICPW